MGTLTAVFLSCFLFALRLSWIESCACCQRPKVGFKTCFSVADVRASGQERVCCSTHPCDDPPPLPHNPLSTQVPSTRDPRAYTRGGMIAMGCTVAGIAVAGVIGVYFFIIKVWLNVGSVC